jgi:hypothetical protein
MRFGGKWHVGATIPRPARDPILPAGLTGDRHDW